MSQPRRKKSSANARIARSPTLIDKQPIVRTIRIRRTATGRIGATTTHTTEEVGSPTRTTIHTTEKAGSPTRAPTTTESRTDLDDSFDFYPDLGSTDSVAQEETRETHTEKQPVSLATTTDLVPPMTDLLILS
jgi:hypothetical protein